MQSPNHTLNALFLQLGLENTDAAIDKFIQRHKPISHVLLQQAEFWNRAQADFIQQALEEDADWAIVVDQLDTMLR